MKIRTFFLVLSMSIIGSIFISKIPSQKQSHFECVDAEVIRAHQTAEGWQTEYVDEYGESWLFVEDERPDRNKHYTFLIDDNGTPYDKSDDIPEII